MLARTAFQIELIHSNLRRTMVAMIQSAAKQNFIEAHKYLELYQQTIDAELIKAKNAAYISEKLLLPQRELPSTKEYSRQSVATSLGITVDSLRNWELNGLVHSKRKSNGHRYYTKHDLRIIQIIQVLREAKYSLEAILHLLNEFSINPKINITTTLDQPNMESEIISVCDQLITSLKQGKKNANELKTMLIELETHHYSQLND